MSHQWRVPPVASSTPMSASWIDTTRTSTNTGAPRLAWSGAHWAENFHHGHTTGAVHSRKSINEYLQQWVFCWDFIHWLHTRSWIWCHHHFFFVFWTQPVHLQSSQTGSPILPTSGVSLARCSSSTAPPVRHLARKLSFLSILLSPTNRE